jgi:hypothetical protein
MTTGNPNKVSAKRRHASALKSKSEATKPQPTLLKGHPTILIIGDILVFLAFAAIGRTSHGAATGFAAIPQVIETALPFIAGWFLVAPWLGAYRRELASNPRKMAGRTLLCWLCAWPVAMTIWGIFVDHGIPPLSFAAVTLLFNAVLFLVWRWPYAMNNENKNRA